MFSSSPYKIISKTVNLTEMASLANSLICTLKYKYFTIKYYKATDLISDGLFTQVVIKCFKIQVAIS